jgi:excisionase family DNA binding protein
MARAVSVLPASPSIVGLPRLINIREAASFLNVSIRTVRRLLKVKKLTFFRVQGQLRFDPAHIDAYLQKRQIKASA